MKYFLLLVLLAIPLANALETTGEWSIDINKDAAESSSKSKGLFTTVFYSNEPRTMLILPKTYSRFRINGDWYQIMVTDLDGDTITYKILLSQEEIINSELNLGDSTDIDLTKDDYNDLRITFEEIRGTMVLVEFENIHERIQDDKIEEIIPEEETQLKIIGDVQEEEIEEDEVIILDVKDENNYKWLVVVIVIVLISIIGTIRYIIMKKRKRLEEKYTYKKV